jgi:hypothetical protein
MKHVLLAVLIFVCACGYTTRGFVYQEGKILVYPVKNEISTTHEGRAYESYTSFPILIEKKLTNGLVNKFNADGHLRIARTADGALRLACSIREYKKEALQVADNDDVTEQRLRLSVHITLHDSTGALLKERDVTGEASFFLSGSLSKTETAAQSDLVDDTARRIVEAVVEDW